MEIYNIPEYLILHLKRFKSSQSKSLWSGRYYGSREKDCQTIYFPVKELNMTEFVLEARDTVDMYVKNINSMELEEKEL
jgi:hypothetical protein